MWRVDVEAVNDHARCARKILTASERQRADAFQLNEARGRFVAARAALRVLLGRYLELAPSEIGFAIGTNGKPYLADGHSADGLQFNVAHSGNIALIAVTRGHEIGVDVERVRSVSNLEPIARRYFHPAEIATILSAPPAQREAAFMRCWTGKEAVLKAIGTGIGDSLASFHVPVDSNMEMFVNPFLRAQNRTVRCWLSRLDIGGDYAAAVAVVGGKARLRCMSFEM